MWIDFCEISRSTKNTGNDEVQVNAKITHKTIDQIKNWEKIDKVDNKSSKGE